MANTTAGEFTPGKGFQIFTSPKASLNISVYGLFRWIDQTPGDQTFTDHLGREREVAARNDMYWQRTMIWFTGFFGDPGLRYNLTVWSLGATQQTLVFGNLQYRVSPALTLGVGMAPNLTVRSMQGSWPFWAGSDRQMTEEFMRAGFSSGVFITGQPLSRFWYTAGVNTNLSQLGRDRGNDGRGMAYSAQRAVDADHRGVRPPRRLRRPGVPREAGHAVRGVVCLRAGRIPRRPARPAESQRDAAEAVGRRATPSRPARWPTA